MMAHKRSATRKGDGRGDGKSLIPQFVEIGNRMRVVRKARNLSQLEIARAVEVSAAAVSLWERGINSIEQERLREIAKKLKIDYDWLYTGEGDQPVLPTVNGHRVRVSAFRQQLDLSLDFDSTSVARRPFAEAIPQMLHGIGVSAEYEKDAAIGWWYLPNAVLGHSKAQNIRVWKVETDKLRDHEIIKGDYAIIDTAQNSPISGDLYAIDANFCVLLKHVLLDEMKQPKKVVLYDEKEPPAKLDASAWMPIDKIKILGRCIGTYRPR